MSQPSFRGLFLYNHFHFLFYLCHLPSEHDLIISWRIYEPITRRVNPYAGWDELRGEFYLTNLFTS